MKNPAKKYSFWVRIIAASLLFVVGLWIILDLYIFKNAVGERLVLSFTGVLILLFAIIRVIPLMKTLESGKSKLISISEIAVNIAVGALLFYAAIKGNKEDSIANFVSKYFNFFIGGVLYLRGFVYCLVSILYKEPSDKTKFWTHMIVLTLGVICIGISESIAVKLSLALAIIAILVAGVLGVEGGMSYGRYRKGVKQEKEISDVKKIVKEETENLPSRKKKKIEEPKKEEAVIEPPQDNEGTYVI